jgi:hypothetical protein
MSVPPFSQLYIRFQRRFWVTGGFAAPEKTKILSGLAIHWEKIRVLEGEALSGRGES